ncbi:helix-turn-helix domain-containing protein [Pseudalkalibacillus caeni]|uniref:Helix-turn-helix domain-containing protein n=1 Tax=Exobacillus caeni TaxID=2574798 RepID=A0A5R9F4F8_9BACL|nr:helix-turn-helix domain-containing protein [Pseudalkalibacillus caeni]TLS37246.1 helix-turn-helix domain-containing protein [Pseudalkalibacillus caeni]
MSKKRHWLTRLRKHKKLTQQEVALKVFIDRGYYALIESGERNPGVEVAKKLADLIGFHHSVFNLESNPFTSALGHAPMVFAHCDMDLRYTWIFNPPNFGADDPIGYRDDELNRNAGTLALQRLKQDVIDQQTPLRRTIPFPTDTGSRSYVVYCHPLFNDRLELIGVATAATEVSTTDDNFQGK